MMGTTTTMPANTTITSPHQRAVVRPPRRRPLPIVLGCTAINDDDNDKTMMRR